jgi:hypothetical protein
MRDLMKANTSQPTPSRDAPDLSVSKSRDSLMEKVVTSDLIQNESQKQTALASKEPLEEEVEDMRERGRGEGDHLLKKEDYIRAGSIELMDVDVGAEREERGGERVRDVFVEEDKMLVDEEKERERGEGEGEGERGESESEDEVEERKRKEEREEKIFQKKIESDSEARDIYEIVRHLSISR